MLARDCPICHGTRHIRFKVAKPVPVVPFYLTGQPPLPTAEIEERSYPCPECSDVINHESVRLVRQVSTIDPYHFRGGDLENVKKQVRVGTAHNLIRKLIDEGLISFEERESFRQLAIIATIGAVSPKFVATLEQRAKAHQFVVAEEVVAEARDAILKWGSERTGPEGPISKQTAVEDLLRALRNAREKAAAKPEGH